ncbi:5'/3'-nucleotidase SurE [Dehalococcoides sp.]|uniref:5'/3'-nucleotidase SurE n=1 Tax=Dehalococcoides sp. TaxID=1966486 RepID=UPI00356A13F7
MKILITNDDGILAEGLRILAETLSQSAEVVVVAPDRERSAIGTAVTLRRSLKVRCDPPMADGITTYAVNGTPTDCVILALGRIVPNIDLVISGINLGQNLGDDVLISGTVAGALQGYLRNRPAMAISVTAAEHYPQAASVAARLAGKIANHSLPRAIFLNINLPDLPQDEINGISLTRLANSSHIDTVTKSYEDGQSGYRLVRQRTANHAAPGTDIWAIERGYISISPLHNLLLGRTQPALSDHHFTDLL